MQWSSTGRQEQVIRSSVRAVHLHFTSVYDSTYHLPPGLRESRPPPSQPGSQVTRTLSAAAQHAVNTNHAHSQRMGDATAMACTPACGVPCMALHLCDHLSGQPQL